MPKTHNMKLQKEFYDLTKSEKKVWEFRLNDEKREKLKVGDFIVFNDTLKVKVIEILRSSRFHLISRYLMTARHQTKENTFGLLPLLYEIYSQ